MLTIGEEDGEEEQKNLEALEDVDCRGKEGREEVKEENYGGVGRKEWKENLLRKDVERTGGGGTWL